MPERSLLVAQWHSGVSKQQSDPAQAQPGDSASMLWGEPGCAHLALPGSAKLYEIAHQAKPTLCCFEHFGHNEKWTSQCWVLPLCLGSAHTSHTAPVAWMENLAQNWAPMPHHSLSLAGAE